jgi:hypothetical protein
MASLVDIVATQDEVNEMEQTIIGHASSVDYNPQKIDSA